MQTAEDTLSFNHYLLEEALISLQKFRSIQERGMLEESIRNMDKLIINAEEGSRSREFYQIIRDTMNSNLIVMDEFYQTQAEVLAAMHACSEEIKAERIAYDRLRSVWIATQNRLEVMEGSMAMMMALVLPVKS